MVVWIFVTGMKDTWAVCLQFTFPHFRPGVLRFWHPKKKDDYKKTAKFNSQKLPKNITTT